MIAPAKFSAALAINRALELLAVLQTSSRPLSTGALVGAVSSRTGHDWSRPTIAGDLRVLASRGLVEAIGEGKGATVRWQLVGGVSIRPSE